MKLTSLHLSFCISLLIHGVALSTYYITKHSNAEAKPISTIGDLSTVEIVMDPEPPAVSVSEPQPVAVKIPEPVQNSTPITMTTSLDATLKVQAAEIMSAAQKEFLVSAEVLQTSISANETRKMPLEVVTPAISSCIASCLTNPKPVYPKEARKHRKQGLVMLEVTVNE